WSKYFDLCKYENHLGFYVNDVLVSTYFIEDFQFFLRGVLMKMGGVAGVTTLPEYRRQRQVRLLAIESLKVMRKNKQFISVLYPFKYSFYRKFGYENCDEIPTIIAPPGNILLPKDFKPLTMKEIPRDKAFDLIMSIRKKYSEKYNNMIFSSHKEWEFHHVEKFAKVFVIYNKDEPVGYFLSSLEKREGAWNVRLNITKHVIGSEDARLTMFDYIKKHTGQTKDFKLWLNGDERFTDYFDDLWDDGLTHSICGGAMFRVVDIPEALKLLNFPKELSFTFTLKVTDPSAPWNEEPLEIEIKDGKITIKSFSGSTFDFETDIKAFTQLYAGYRTIGELVEMKKVKINTKKQELIDTAFPKCQTRLTTLF
ncbi:MAG: GNAT family N-acetyltransferase, partial [Candidatus Heimdallarchaeota archaeon]